MRHPIQDRVIPRRAGVNKGKWIGLPLLLLSAGLMLAQPCAAAPFAFEYTGSLSIARSGYSATLLQNGKVLVAGGFNTTDGVLATAELYDPGTGNWTATGSLATARRFHTATLLPNDKVLVAAGFDNNANLDGLVSAELYDPGTMTEATMASGRGSLAGQGDTATFNFRASQTGDRPSGSLTFSDSAAGIAISRAKVRTLTLTGNSADLDGTARLGDGSKVTYSVSVSDNSSDGSTDTFSITPEQRLFHQRHTYQRRYPNSVTTHSIAR
jgi:hypothetical protein